MVALVRLIFGPHMAAAFLWAVNASLNESASIVGTLREASAKLRPANMVKVFADAQARRSAMHVACGLSAMAVVMVAAPALELQTEEQGARNEWRLRAHAFLEAYDPEDGIESDYRFGPLAARRAGDMSVSDRDAWAPFQTFTPVHFENAERLRRDLHCLATAVYYESRNEAVLGQLAVAEVVLNRVRHRLYPNNVCAVVYEGTDRSTGLSIYGTNMSCQFSFTCDGSERRFPVRGRPWETAQQVAAHAMMGFSESVTQDATHYHANYVSPYWAPRLVHTRTIGAHIFYRFPTSQEPRGRRGA